MPTFLSDINLPRDPGSALLSATKQYVDSKSGLTQATADGRYLQLTGGTMAGNISLATYSITNVWQINSAYLAGLVGTKGGDITLSNSIDAATNQIYNLPTPSVGTSPATKTYVDAADALKVAKTGDTMTGNLVIDNAGAASLVVDRGNTAASGWVQFATAGVGKWELGPIAGGTEDLYLVNRGGGGSTALYMNATTNLAQVAADPTAALGIATKQYVDGKTFTLSNDSVTNAILANMPAYTFKGNWTGSAADPVDMTVAQVKSTLSYSAAEVGAQPSDPDLTTIAGLTATTGNMILSVASAWASQTPAQVKTALSLNLVDNTSDANKPVSTAQAAANALKANIASPTFTGVPAAPTAAAATSTTQLATTAFVTTADNLKLNLTGGVLSGALTTTYLTATSGAGINTASGTAGNVEFLTAGSLRWTFGKGPGAETGANAGAEFNIAAWTDAGAWLSNPLSIERSTGNVSLGGSIGVKDNQTIWLDTARTVGIRFNSATSSIDFVGAAATTVNFVGKTVNVGSVVEA